MCVFIQYKPGGFFFLHSPPRTSYQCPRGTLEYFHRGRHSGNTVDVVYTQHRGLANQIYRNPTVIVLISLASHRGLLIKAQHDK